MLSERKGTQREGGEYAQFGGWYGKKGEAVTTLCSMDDVVNAYRKFHQSCAVQCLFLRVASLRRRSFLKGPEKIEGNYGASRRSTEDMVDVYFGGWAAFLIVLNSDEQISL